jgi:hypothetical protein
MVGWQKEEARFHGNGERFVRDRRHGDGEQSQPWAGARAMHYDFQREGRFNLGGQQGGRFAPRCCARFHDSTMGGGIEEGVILLGLECFKEIVCLLMCPTRGCQWTKLRKWRCSTGKVQRGGQRRWMSKRLKVVVLGVMGYRVHAALHVDSEYGNHTKKFLWSCAGE